MRAKRESAKWERAKRERAKRDVPVPERQNPRAHCIASPFLGHRSLLSKMIAETAARCVDRIEGRTALRLKVYVHFARADWLRAACQSSLATMLTVISLTTIQYEIKLFCVCWRSPPSRRWRLDMWPLLLLLLCDADGYKNTSEGSTRLSQGGGRYFDVEILSNTGGKSNALWVIDR